MHVFKGPYIPNFKRHYVKICIFSAFSFFFQYCVKFFLFKLSRFYVLLVINNLFSTVIGVGGPSKFLKRSFDFWILSSCLAAVSFALDGIFILFISFPFRLANPDCLFSSKFLWLLMYSKCYFSMARETRVQSQVESYQRLKNIIRSYFA